MRQRDNRYKNIRVLIIDDDLLSIKMLKLKLKNQFKIKQIFTAKNGLEGLKFIRKKKRHIDIIFLDINMPVMDGIEFLRHLVTLDFFGAITVMSGIEEGILAMVGGLLEAHQLNYLGSLQKSECFQDLNLIFEKYLAQDSSPFKIPSVFLNNSKEILQGIKREEFINYYQPKIALSSGQIIGCEVLIRWQHSTLGLIPPGKFLPTLIEADKSLTLTKEVISHAMRDLTTVLKHKKEFNFSINITAQDLNWLDLPTYIAEQTELFKLEPQHLIFEITETELFNNLTSALETLTKLKLLGFKLSIDDFGTGFSNLEKLQLIKFDEIKIDKRFVHNAHLDETKQAILKFSCSLGKSLDLIITAEGIETFEDLNNLADLPVDNVQGFYYSKPLSIERLIALLKSSKR